MMNSKKWDYGLLALFPLIYLLTITKYFWVLPDPSDPLEYVGSIPWGQTVGYFPWLDRINLGSGLALFYHLVPGPAYMTGPIYALFVTTLACLVGQIWLYQRVGFAAAAALGVFVNSGWYFLFFGSQILPEPTMVLYALLAVVFFLWSEDRPQSRGLIFTAGVFAAMACFSKVTAILLPMFIAASLFRKRRLTQSFWLYCGGLVAGAVISILLYSLLYGFASLISTVQMFFGSNLQANYVGRGGFNNAVSYYDVIVDRLYLPTFLGLLVCGGAYRQAQAKRLIVFAWSFVVTIFLIYLVTNRGYTPIPNYIYPGFFFTTLALSAYLGSLIPTPNLTRKLTLTFVCLLALIVGLRFGMTHDPTRIFEPGYYPNLQKWVRMIFNLGVIALVILLVSLEVKPTARRALALLLVAAFWTSAYAGGKTRAHFTSVLIPNSEFFYYFAGVLNKPSAETFDVFVEAWKKNDFPDRLKWLFRIFFDQKYDRTHGQAANEKLIQESIQFMTSQEQVAKGSGQQILTDQPDSIQSMVPTATVVDQFEWNGVRFYVLNRNKK